MFYVSVTTELNFRIFSSFILCFGFSFKINLKDLSYLHCDRLFINKYTHEVFMISPLTIVIHKEELNDVRLHM